MSDLPFQSHRADSASSRFPRGAVRKSPLNCGEFGNGGSCGGFNQSLSSVFPISAILINKPGGADDRFGDISSVDFAHLLDGVSRHDQLSSTKFIRPITLSLIWSPVNESNLQPLKFTEIYGSEKKS